MKKRYILLFAMVLLLPLAATTLGAQAGMPSYPMKFRFRDAGGQLHDTIVPGILYKSWSQSAGYPEYVKWKGQPFAIRKTGEGKPALYTDSASSYTGGQEVGVAYLRRSSTGRFMLDYIQTDFAAFVNDSPSPNLIPELVDRRLVFKAGQAIAPDTELTVSYQAIVALFPGDESIRQLILH